MFTTCTVAVHLQFALKSTSTPVPPFHAVFDLINVMSVVSDAGSVLPQLLSPSYVHGKAGMSPNRAITSNKITAKGGKKTCALIEMICRAMADCILSNVTAAAHAHLPKQ